MSLIPTSIQHDLARLVAALERIATSLEALTANREGA